MRIVIAGEGSGQAGELKQALVGMGLDWEVAAVDAAGPDGMTADAPVDVFVCPLRLGTLQGAEILAQMRNAYPGAVRIVLLDKNEESHALHALDCAHRMLNTPLDASELIEAVDSVVDLRELLDNAELKQAIGRIGSLPPPPRIYIELTQLLRDPDASNFEVAEVLSQDPGVAAKVLRLCNSAFFSGGRQITDMRTAVTRLGMQSLRGLVLASETFGSVQSSDAVDRDAMQERALMTSRLAARLLGGSSAELAATAGLLAEVGRLLPGVRAGDDESGPHYAEAGAYLLGLWGLPMPIVEAVAYHRTPARLRGSGFWVVGAVHVASALVLGEPVDEKYLRQVGVIDKLPKWREMAESMAQPA
ncbi:HDOD domain-containing protein [Lysobacter korlensis]|uniref:HDOD domain-containing protein n=1 Tax=Lysobacter korlensis TaxID=553636 RepID=A0ABV6S0H3_9GAMM